MEKKIKLDNDYSEPHGVPLHTIINSLNDPSKEITQNKTNVLIKSGDLETVIDITKPNFVTEDKRVVSSVTTVKTKIPKSFESLFKNYNSVSTLNRFASLGAITNVNDKYYVGTKLTIFEGDNSWNLHLPLLVFSIIISFESIIGALTKVRSGEKTSNKDSYWTDKDFEVVEKYLSQICVCNSGGLGFTAEFPLTENASSVAISKKMDTALFTLKADESHLDLGGGLFCLLNMPHNFADQSQLFKIINKLNQIEMEKIDFPPHYGAWTFGNECLSYVSFLPNAFYNIEGTKNIAVNIAFWASQRAVETNKILEKEGIYL